MQSCNVIFPHQLYKFPQNPCLPFIQTFMSPRALPKNNLILVGSRRNRAGSLSFCPSSDSGPPIRQFLGISEPLRRSIVTSRKCQSDDVLSGTHVCLLLHRVTTDRYQTHTKSSPIKPLTTIYFPPTSPLRHHHVSSRVNSHFTVNPTWLPRHPSTSAQSHIATSSHRTRARPVTSC